jgi:sodium-dependent phosphate cotransporter
LGANIGTTVTAILAALVTGDLSAIIVAFSHLLFNISGMIAWWPFKFVPISMAEKFAEIAVRYKIVAILYIVVVFFLVPIALISILR